MKPFHRHQWRIVSASKQEWDDYEFQHGSWTHNGMVYFTVILQRCVDCGDLRTYTAQGHHDILPQAIDKARLQCLIDQAIDPDFGTIDTDRLAELVLETADYAKEADA
jgi:hypothetical protein